MMMPTWAGTVSGRASGVGWGCVPATSVTSSDLHDLGLFAAGHVVDLLDEAVRQLLQPILGAAFVFLRDATVFFGFAQVIQRITPTVAHRDTRLFSAVVDLLHQLFAAVLRELWKHQANDLAVIGWIDAQIGFLNSLFDWPEHAAVPWLDQHHVRIRRAD